MVTLLTGIHFWTLREDIIVKDADIGAYRYQEKGTVNKERVYYNQRKRYIESRDGILVLKNNRPAKLKDSLKELEEILAKEKLVSEGWRGGSTYQLFFASGLTVFLTVNSSGDLVSVVCDKFLIGKLLSENVTSVAYSPSYFIFSYNDARLTLIHATKPVPSVGFKSPFKFSCQDFKVITCEGIGPAGRRFERKLSINLTEKMVLVWWQTGEDEVYPWSPLDKDRDRANLLVYSMSGVSLQLLSYCRTELSPLSVVFSQIDENVILTVEQGFDKVGGVTVLSCVYEVEKGSLRRISVTSIPLDAPLTAHAHNPSETCLLLACNNGVLALHCEARGMTHVTKAGLIPSYIAWLSSGTLLAVVNDRGQIQVFDMALSLVRTQLLLEDSAPQRLLDFSDYFSYQPSLRKLMWASCSPLKAPLDHEGVESSFPLLLLHFVNGPLACLRFISCSQNLKSDESWNKSGARDPVSILSSSLLVRQYIKNRQWDEAINLVVSLSWETEGSVALQCLFTVVGSLLKLPLNSQRESQMEAALSSFLLSPVRVSPAVEEEFGPPVRALTRRFFFKLLRNGSLEKSYRLAIDLKDHDCYLHVHHVARCHGNQELASLALQSARELNSDSCWSGSCSSNSAEGSCSESGSTCSTCESEEEEGEDAEEEMEKAENNTQRKDQNGFQQREMEEEEVVEDGEMEEEPLLEPATTVKKKYIHHKTKPLSKIPPPVPPVSASTPSHSVAVQSSQDGTITINIRQGTEHIPNPDSHSMSSPAKQMRGLLEAVNGAASSFPSQNGPRVFKQPIRLASKKESFPPGSKPGPGRLKTVKEVCEASISSEDHQEENAIIPHREREHLRRQYEQAIFQEVTTEEEDGGTVKVVHFGVV